MRSSTSLTGNNSLNDLITLSSSRLSIRALIASAMIAILLFAWFSVRWQVGNMLASLTQETDPNIVEISDISVKWAPSDPRAFSLKSVAAESQIETISFLEEAVRMAPADYRWRTELGRAYEQNEQHGQAENQLTKAVELAPSYSLPRWHLGNFYLRQENSPMAMSELRIAAINNPTYREQVYSLIWDYSGKDAGRLSEIAGEHPDLRARLAYFLAARGRAGEALENWNVLSQADKDRHVAIARSIALGLFDQKHFLQSLEFAKQYGAEIGAQPDTVTNGSFEDPIVDDDSRFGWHIGRNEPKFEATVDNKISRTGTRSNRITLKGYSKPSFSSAFQTIVVEPLQKYRLSFWLRTENLKSVGLPLLEVLDASGGNSLVRSSAFPAGTQDWRQITVEFTTPNGCDGITIRTTRDFCGDDCPIAGTFWSDDYVLTRIGK